MSEVKALLEPLIKEAEEKGMWLRSTYQGIEFSPAELRKANSEGRFIWGPVNWTLIDPSELLEDPSEAYAKVESHNKSIRERIAKARGEQESGGEHGA